MRTFVLFVLVLCCGAAWCKPEAKALNKCYFPVDGNYSKIPDLALGIEIIDYTAPKTETLGDAGRFKELVYLGCDREQIPVDFLTQFAKCPKLADLRLMAHEGNKGKIGSLAKALPALKRLTLNQKDFESLAPSDIAELGQSTVTELIILSGQNLNKDQWAAISALETLKILDLGCVLSATLLKTSGLPKGLEELRLQKTAPGAGAFIEAASEVPTIKRLLVDDRINDAILGGISDVATIEELTLRGTLELSSADPLKKLGKLVLLDICGIDKETKAAGIPDFRKALPKVEVLFREMPADLIAVDLYALGLEKDPAKRKDPPVSAISYRADVRGTGQAKKLDPYTELRGLMLLTWPGCGDAAVNEYFLHAKVRDDLELLHILLIDKNLKAGAIKDLKGLKKLRVLVIEAMPDLAVLPELLKVAASIPTLECLIIYGRGPDLTSGAAGRDDKIVLDKDIAPLAKCKNLRSLSFVACSHLSFKGLEPVLQLKTLRGFHLRECPYPAPIDINWIVNFPHIQQFDFLGTCVKGGSELDVTKLQTLRLLKWDVAGGDKNSDGGSFSYLAKGYLRHRCFDISR